MIFCRESINRSIPFLWIEQLRLQNDVWGGGEYILSFYFQNCIFIWFKIFNLKKKKDKRWRILFFVSVILTIFFMMYSSENTSSVLTRVRLKTCDVCRFFYVLCKWNKSRSNYLLQIITSGMLKNQRKRQATSCLFSYIFPKLTSSVGWFMRRDYLFLYRRKEKLQKINFATGMRDPTLSNR